LLNFLCHYLKKKYKEFFYLCNNQKFWGNNTVKRRLVYCIAEALTAWRRLGLVSAKRRLMASGGSLALEINKYIIYITLDACTRPGKLMQGKNKN